MLKLTYIWFQICDQKHFKKPIFIEYRHIQLP